MKFSRRAVKLRGEGMTNAAIARRLHCSPTTIKTLLDEAAAVGWIPEAGTAGVSEKRPYPRVIYRCVKRIDDDYFGMYHGATADGVFRLVDWATVQALCPVLADLGVGDVHVFPHNAARAAKGGKKDDEKVTL